MSSACSTPQCDALARDPFDSNDMSAWHSLAYRLEKKLSALQSETALTNAAPQPSTAAPGTAPSKEGVGQRDAAAAAPSGQTDEKGRPMTYWGGVVPSAVARSDEWRAAALRLGEQLTTTGPNGYYSMTPTQWLDWCENSLPSASAALTDEELHEIIYSRVSGPTQLRNAIAKAIIHDLRTADRTISKSTKEE